MNSYSEVSLLIAGPFAISAVLIFGLVFLPWYRERTPKVPRWKVKIDRQTARVLEIEDGAMNANPVLFESNYYWRGHAKTIQEAAKFALVSFEELNRIVIGGKVAIKFKDGPVTVPLPPPRDGMCATIIKRSE